MKIDNLPFHTTDWSRIEPTRHPGETGEALWRTLQASDIRLRMVEYSPGYLADHWCTKGHVLLVLDGELCTELADGRVFTLTAGQLSGRRQCRTPPVFHRRRGQIVHRRLTPAAVPPCGADFIRRERVRPAFAPACGTGRRSFLRAKELIGER